MEIEVKLRRKYMIYKTTFFRTIVLLGFFAFFLIGCTTTLNVTVTFDTNGGNILEPIETSGTTSIIIPDNPIKDGFVFDGWYWDNQTFQRPFTANSLLNEPITNNITVYAKWLSEDLVNSSFTIVFDVQGGSVISNQTVTFRQFVSKPNDPTRLGYLFGGWYKDTNYNAEWNFTTDKIESNVTLYAKWNLLSDDYHIIHYVSNFETTVPSQQVLKGSGLVAPTVNRIGYTLEGWYTSLNNGETLDEKWAFTTNTVNSNFTLYAKWNINRYTIAFNTNGGTSVQSITENYNTVVHAPTNPTRAGYVFGGWYQDVEQTMPYTFTSMQASNITVYASWLRTITFVTYSSQNINIVQYKPLDNIILPSNLVKEGHTFDGWYSNQGLTTPFDSSTMPDNNLTLYAKWVVNQYTISFNTEGGTDKLEMVINFGENVNIANNSEKTGHTFAGWFIDENKVNAFNLSKMPAYDITLYAKWNINQYDLSFNTNGGSIISSTKVTYNETITLPNEPTRIGHTFEGWFNDNTLLTPYNYTNMPAQNITIYAKWKTNTYTLTFITNSDISIETKEFLFGSSLAELQQPIKEDYIFGGWFIDQLLVNQLNESTMPAQNIILYAKWLRSITFVSNGGSNVLQLLAQPGNSITTPIEPTKEGHTFDGWFSDDDLALTYQFTTMPDDNITLYAKWIINSYSIYYNSNGGSDIELSTHLYNSNLPDPIIPTKTGHTFIGWYTDESLFTAFDLESMPSRDLNLYAKWGINQYSIEFVTNGGSEVSIIVGDYSSVVLEPISPTRVLYTFTGWYDDIELTNKYNFTTMPANNITLFAGWIPNEYTITFVLNGGEGDSTLTTRYTTTIEEPTPTKIGHTFDGWFTDANLTNKYTFTTMPPQNFTLYAKWNINAYTISFETFGGTTNTNVVRIYNTSIPTITDPMKEGYTFTGWFIDASYTQPFTYTLMPATNFTLYAQWKNSIAFDSNGGSTVSTITNDAGSSVTQPTNPTKEGHTFIDWYSDVELTTPYEFTIIPEFNITIYAKWSVNQYIIGFELNGGDYIETIVQDYGTLIELPIPNRLGHTFKGWYIDESLTLVNIFTTIQAYNVVLYAKWEINQYSITFNSNGGSHIDTILQNFNTYVEEPEQPSKEGYTFVGWYADEEFTTKYNFDKIGIQNIVLYAKWVINDYDITYMVASGDFNLENALFLVPGEVIIQAGARNNSSGILTSKGRLYTWGFNDYGNLGTGVHGNHYSPVDITSKFALSNNDQIVQFSLSGLHSAVITLQGRVFMWGLNSAGQLGDGTTISKQTPIEITNKFNLQPGEKIVKITLGENYSLAITQKGKIFMWGSSTGQVLGDGTFFNRYVPTEITNRFTLLQEEIIIQISTGSFHTAVLTNTGRVFSWGSNQYGQIGIGNNIHPSSPVEITTAFGLSQGDKIVNISLGGSQSSAISLLGRIFTWGHNYYGQLGVGSIIDKNSPTEITGQFPLSNDKVNTIIFGMFHSIAITDAGRVFTWGRNNLGQLGTDTIIDSNTPLEITNMFDNPISSNLKEVSLGTFHSIGYTTEGHVYSWGWNSYGQLGLGNNYDTYKPLMLSYVTYLETMKVTYTYGSAIIDYTPIISGLSFSGWYSDYELLNLFDLSQMPAYDIALFAYNMKHDE